MTGEPFGPDGFDPSSVPARERFELLPPGWYLGEIISASFEDSRANPDNHYLKLMYEILSGPYQGRKIFDNLNIFNTNEQAQLIAQQGLAQLCEVLGIAHLTNVHDLERQQVEIKVDIRKDKKGLYDDQNVVRGVRALGDQSAPGAVSSGPAAASTQAKPPPATTAPAKSAPPWKQN